MKKYIVLYNAPAEAMAEMMKNKSEEEQKKGMEEWTKWMEKYSANFVDQGAPAGKNTRVLKDSVEEVSNDIGGYSIMQAESKEELIKILQENKHFMIPCAYIDVMEWVQM